MPYARLGGRLLAQWDWVCHAEIKATWLKHRKMTINFEPLGSCVPANAWLRGGFRPVGWANLLAVTAGGGSCTMTNCCTGPLTTPSKSSVTSCCSQCVGHWSFLQLFMLVRARFFLSKPWMSRPNVFSSATWKGSPTNRFMIWVRTLTNDNALNLLMVLCALWQQILISGYLACHNSWWNGLSYTNYVCHNIKTHVI